MVRVEACAETETCVQQSGGLAACVDKDAAAASCPSDQTSSECGGVDYDGRSGLVVESCDFAGYGARACAETETCVVTEPFRAECVAIADAARSCPAEMFRAECEQPPSPYAPSEGVLSFCNDSLFAFEACADDEICDPNAHACAKIEAIAAQCDPQERRAFCQLSDLGPASHHAITMCDTTILTAQTCGAREACVEGVGGAATCIREETICANPATRCAADFYGDPIVEGVCAQTTYTKEACSAQGSCDDARGYARCVWPPGVYPNEPASYPEQACLGAQVLARCTPLETGGTGVELRCERDGLPFRTEQCIGETECTSVAGVDACRARAGGPPAGASSLTIRLRWSGDVHLDLAVRTPNNFDYYFGAYGPRAADPFGPSLEFRGGCERAACARAGRAWEESFSYPAGGHPSGRFLISVTNRSGGTPTRVTLEAVYPSMTVPIPYQQSAVANSESVVPFVAN